MTYDYRRAGEGHELIFPEPGVIIRISRIAESRRKMEAEVEALTLAGGFLERANTDLLSTHARETLAKSLIASDGETGAGWRDLLRLAFERTIREHRRVDPPIVLADVSEEPPGRNRYMVWPFLPVDETTIMYGPKGIGKSQAALAIGVCAATGMPLPGGVRCEAPGPVMYYDWEENEQTHAERLRGLCRGLGLAEWPRKLHYRQLLRPLVDLEATLARDRTELGLALSVFDSLGPAAGADLNENQTAIVTTGALRRIGGTRLVVGQISAEGAGAHRGHTFGSVFWEYHARAIWELRGSETTDGMTFINTKMSRAARYRTPLGWLFDHTEDDRVIELSFHSPLDDPDLEQHVPLLLRAHALMRQHAQRLNEMAQELGAKENTLYRALRRDPRSVQLNRGEEGRGNTSLWGLKSDNSDK